MTNEEAEQAAVESHFQFFRVSDGKANMAPRIDMSSAERATWRRMVGVRLGNGAGLYPFGGDVGVAELWTWPNHLAGSDSAGLNRVRELVAVGG